MILTEEKATTTRCCGPEGCGTLRDSGGPMNQPPNYVRFCIASACMAWRPGTVTRRRQASPGNAALDIDPIYAEETVRDTTGYCGLAGKP